MKTFQQSHQQSPSPIRLSMLLNEPGTQTGLTETCTLVGRFGMGTRQRISQELQLLIWPRRPLTTYLLHITFFLSPLTEWYLFSSSSSQVSPREPLSQTPIPTSSSPPVLTQAMPSFLNWATHYLCFGYQSKCHFLKETFPDHSHPPPKLEPSPLICSSIWHLLLFPPSTSQNF